jgi:hypothetical protein
LVLIVVGVVVGVAKSASNAGSAAVGDCLDDAGAEHVRTVDCGSADAKYKVLGVVEDKTQIQAGITACDAYPSTTAYFWQGPDTGVDAKGKVLCLGPAR